MKARSSDSVTYTYIHPFLKISLRLVTGLTLRCVQSVDLRWVPCRLSDNLHAFYLATTRPLNHLHLYTTSLLHHQTPQLPPPLHYLNGGTIHTEICTIFGATRYTNICECSVPCAVCALCRIVCAQCVHIVYIVHSVCAVVFCL